MSAITGNAVGFIATLYRVASVITDKSETNLEAAITSGNKVNGVKEMSTGLKSERSIIDVPVFGEDTMSKIPGQADPGTFDFSAAYDGTDAVHNAIRDDSGLTQATYIVVFTQSATAKTYAAFDGYTASGSVNFPIDDVISLDASIARSGSVTWVDNT